MELSEPANRFYTFLLEKKKFVALENCEIASIMQVDEFEIGKYLRELENADRISIWRRGKFGIAEFKAKEVLSPPAPPATDSNKEHDFRSGTDSTLGLHPLPPQNEKIMIHSGIPPSGVSHAFISPPDNLLPRVHFLEATAIVKDVFTHQDLNFQHDSAHIEITFGQWRRKITFTIQENHGITASQLTNALNKIMGLISQKLERQVNLYEFKVANMHMNIDYIGLRLEGLKAVTLFEVEHWLSRLYAKQEAVRSEGVLSDGEITLGEAYKLLMRSHEDRDLIRKSAGLMSEGINRLAKIEHDISAIKRVIEKPNTLNRLLSAILRKSHLRQAIER